MFVVIAWKQFECFFVLLGRIAVDWSMLQVILLLGSVVPFGNERL